MVPWNVWPSPVVQLVLAMLLGWTIALDSVVPVAADELGLAQQRQIDDLRIAVWIAPSVFRPLGVEIQLSDQYDRPVTNVRRVDVAFAMLGMNHGARGIVAEPVGNGLYQAAGRLLAMEGPSQMSVRVERADGRVQTGVFLFVAPPEPPTGFSAGLYDRPTDGPEQVVDIAVAPEGIVPDRIDVIAGRPVRLEIMYVDRPTCGSLIRLRDPPTATDLNAEGLAELAFTPTRTGRLSLTCDPTALSIG